MRGFRLIVVAAVLLASSACVQEWQGRLYTCNMYWDHQVQWWAWHCAEIKPPVAVQ